MRWSGNPSWIDFLDDELFRDYADDVAAVLERSVRDRAHQPDHAAAINELILFPRD